MEELTNGGRLAASITKISTPENVKPTNRNRAMNILTGEEDTAVTQTPAQMIDVMAINLPDYPTEAWEKNGLQYLKVKAP
jgi:hypothetical protein